MQLLRPHVEKSRPRRRLTSSAPLLLFFSPLPSLSGTSRRIAASTGKKRKSVDKGTLQDQRPLRDVILDRSVAPFVPDSRVFLKRLFYCPSLPFLLYLVTSLPPSAQPEKRDFTLQPKSNAKSRFTISIRCYYRQYLL